MNQKTQTSKGLSLGSPSSLLYSRVLCIALVSAFVLGLFSTGCTRDENPSSDELGGKAINFTVSSSSANTPLVSKSGSVSENSSETPSTVRSYELSASVTNSDFGTFTMIVEPNDGLFRYSEVAGSSSVSATSSSSENASSSDLSTKTQYGEYFYNSSGKPEWQRLDWVKGDKFTLWSDKARVVTYLSNNGYDYANYEVIGVSTDNRKSKGMVMPENSGNGLWWADGSSEHKFVGFYPAKTPESTFARAYIDVNVPSTQVAIRKGATGVYEPELGKYGYMTAYQSTPPTNSLNISFSPKFSAIEFRLKSESGVTMKLNKVTLTSSSSFLASKGSSTNYRLGYNTDGSEIKMFYPSASTSTCSQEVELSFLDSDGTTAISPVITSSTETSFVILLSGATDLSSLKVNFNVDITKGGTTTTNQNRNLELKLKPEDGGTPITIPACSKLLITNLNIKDNTYTYYFVPTDPSDITHSASTSSTAKIVSYKINGSSLLPVDWSSDGKYYNSVSDAMAGNNPKTMSSSSFLTSVSPLSASSPALTGVNLTIDYSAPEINTSKSVIINGSDFNDGIAGNGVKGSTTLYYNLSNPSNPNSNDIAESANTYIVNGEGYYRIPLVMGNGVKNNAPNTIAFRQLYFTDYLGYAMNSADSSPYLQDNGRGVPTSAYVVWEDWDFIDVTNTTDFTLQSGGTPALITTTTQGEQTIYWLNFHIKAVDKQGIGVIAVTNASGVVMWSWTIWLTDYIPFNYPGYASSTDKDVEVTSYSDASDPLGSPLNVTMMPRNLGWCELSTSYFRRGEYYPNEAYIRLVQAESGKVAVIKAERPSMMFEESNRRGYHPFYQWGRKDALLPGTGTSTATTYNTTTPQLSTMGRMTSGNGGGEYYRLVNKNSWTIREFIMYPWIQSYDNTSAQSPYRSGTTVNLWCADNTNFGVEKPTVKSIYDPSPAGYTVPRGAAFNAFIMSNGEANATTKTSWEGLQGFNFYNKYSESVAGAGATNTIYFPNSGQTRMNVLVINNENIGGTYWTATPSSKMSNGLRTVPYLNFGMYNATTSFLEIWNNVYHYPFTVRCTREE